MVYKINMLYLVLPNLNLSLGQEATFDEKTFFVFYVFSLDIKLLCFTQAKHFHIT